MRFDHITGTPLLPVSLWFCLYIFCWRDSSLVGFSFFFSDGCSADCFEFDALMRGGHLMIQLCHLGLSLDVLILMKSNLCFLFSPVTLSFRAYPRIHC